MNESDVRELLTSLAAAPPAHTIDVEQAIRGGRRRHRVRVVAAVASSLAVLAAAALLVVTLPGRPPAVVTPTTPTNGPVTGVAQIAGRWLAQEVDGVDVTPYRDLSGLPAELVVGGSGDTTLWETNGLCGPLTRGHLAVGADGSFRATLDRPPVVVYCSMARSTPPATVRSLLAARWLTLTAGTSSTPATLTMLDAARHAIAVWRLDPAATPAAICARGPHRVASAGPLTTVEDVRATVWGPMAHPGKDAFPGVPGGEVAAWCWTGGDVSWTSYVVAPDGSARTMMTTSGEPGTPSGIPAVP